jgi:protein-tyrosine phosphatase
MLGAMESSGQEQPPAGMFRSLQLPPEYSGVLMLHSMPGREEPLEEVWEEIRRGQVDCIVSLADIQEINTKSPLYGRAILAGTVPCERVEFPIRDFGVPRDHEAFWQFTCALAARLRVGQRLLVHCAAGVGRTAMLAACVLVALGVSAEDAKAAVSRAGSFLEYYQTEMIVWCERRPISG